MVDLAGDQSGRDQERAEKDQHQRGGREAFTLAQATTWLWSSFASAVAVPSSSQ
jgi:hypothetical protein